MGEAKRRGSTEQRVVEAKAKAKALAPDKQRCPKCKSDIPEFERVDARSALKIDAAYFGYCAKCMLPLPLLTSYESAIRKYSERFWEEVRAQEKAIQEREDELKMDLDDDLFWTHDDEPESDTQRIDRYRATFRAVLKTRSERTAHRGRWAVFKLPLHLRRQSFSG